MRSIIQKKNGGLSDARNKGLELATGRYILFVDADDYIDRNTCEYFSTYANLDYDILIGEAIVEGGTCNLDHMPASQMVYSGKEYLKHALHIQKAPMAAWLNVYRKEFLTKNQLSFKFGILHEDEEFTPRAFLKAERVICTGKHFYHYVIREGSITTKKDKRKNAIDLYSTCCELENIYNGIEDKELQNLLLDSLVTKYLNMFQVGKLYRYGKDYLHKAFIKRNAKRRRTKRKAWLYCFSHRLYYWVNFISKKLK